MTHHEVEFVIPVERIFATKVFYAFILNQERLYSKVVFKFDSRVDGLIV